MVYENGEGQMLAQRKANKKKKKNNPCIILNGVLITAGK